MTQPPETVRRRLWSGWCVWIVFAVAMTAVLLTSRHERTVMHNYRLGAERWLASEPLYDDTGHGFLYFPQAAVLFVPWSALPHRWGEVIWRLFNIGILAAGTRALCRVAQPQTWPALYPVVSLVAVILGWPAVRTGQMTVVMTGLMLLSLADLMEERWTRAAAWLWLAFALKPIILPFLLLATALWLRPMAVRMALGLLITTALPFCCQRLDYVVSQYQLLPVMLRSAHDLGQRGLFPHLFGMLDALGYAASDRVQTLSRGGAGLAVLVAGIVLKRRMPVREFGPWLGAGTASYILLFNPRTESNTYGLLGPFLGYFLAKSLQERRTRDAALLTLIAVCVIGNYEIGQHLFSGKGIFVLAPAATLAFAGWLVWDARQRSASRRG